jgi:hypothetical protein
VAKATRDPDAQAEPHGLRAKPTAPDPALTGRSDRRARNLRRVGIAFLVAIVGLAATGVLGQRTSTVVAAGGGYQLTVTYPSVVRPGVDVRWNVVVVNRAGFGKRLSIALSRHYFDIFDLNTIRPDADSAVSDGQAVTYTWDSPPGTEFELSLDAYAEYGEHLGLDGFASIVVQGRSVVTARYHTRWVP